MTGLKEISVVVVTYNSAEVIEACLRPLSDIAQVIVVDNASGDDTIARVQRLRPDVHIIANHHNPGFGSAANQGFAQIQTSYALLINPDAVLLPAAVEKLVASAEASDYSGIVAPLLYSPKRGLELEVKGPGERTPSRMDTVPDGCFCTWFATGAAWLVNMAAWRVVGGFDENLFLYGEDLDVCRRMTAGGYSIMFVPGACGEHLVSQATQSTRAMRWRKEWNIVWSHLYLMAKHESKVAASAEAWRLVRKHGPKTIFYALVVQPKRFWRDLAVSHAAFSFLRGGVPKRNS